MPRKNWTEAEKREMITRMGSSDLDNLVRQLFCNWSNKINQACSQARPLDIFEQRTMEFAAANELIALIRNTPTIKLKPKLGHGVDGYGLYDSDGKLSIRTNTGELADLIYKALGNTDKLKDLLSDE